MTQIILDRSSLGPPIEMSMWELNSNECPKEPPSRGGDACLSDL